MYHRLEHQQTTFLLRKNLVREELPEDIYRGSRLVIVHGILDLIKDSKTLNVTNSTSPVNVYYDDVGDLFVTNYDEEEEVLDIPIQLIVVRKQSITIFLKGFVVEIDKSSAHKCLFIESFYMNNRLSNEEEGPSRKKTRYCENRKNTGSELSQEFGVYTDSLQSCFSESSVSNIQMSSDSLLSSSSSSNSDISPQTIKKVAPIPVSRIDGETQHRMQLSWYKQKLVDLFSKIRFSTQGQLVSPEKLVLKKSFAASDVPTEKMIEEMKSTLAFEELDPIVVSKKENSFEVLSGSRRVHAYKKVGFNQIRVNSVKAEEVSAFKLFHFFSTNFQGRQEPDTTDFIDFVRGVLSYLELSCDEVKKWSSNEIKDVFSICFDGSVKNRHLFEICLHDDLANIVYETSSIAKFVSTRFVVEVARKYKTNPTLTLRVMASIPANSKEQDITKKLATITPDPRQLLSKKHISAANIDALMKKFGCDPMFPKFVKGNDLRCNKTTLSFEAICKKFNEYRKKNASPSGNANQTTVIVSSDFADSDFLITDTTTLMQNFMDSKIDATVVLLGTQVENGSIHTLLIDEKFGFEDEDGILHNHCSLTFFYKRNGSFVTGRDLTNVFLAKKTSRRSVMSTKDFHVFYKDNICSRFEVEDPFMQQIAYQIMSQAGIISVPNEEMQKNLNAILNNRYSSSE